MYSIDDEKYIISSEDNKYTLNLTATGAGKMEFFVQDYDVLNDKANSDKTFQNVMLTQGKQMLSAVGGDISTPNTSLYLTNSAGNTIIGEIMQDGTENTTPFAVGNVDGKGDVTIFDALEILKYLVNMDSTIQPIKGMYDERVLNAALITQESKNSRIPTIFDALEILKKLVGMPNGVDILVG